MFSGWTVTEDEMAQEEEEEVESYNAHNEYFRIEKEARLARIELGAASQYFAMLS